MINKGRYWSAIGWLESLPKDWKTRIVKSNLPVVISPLHNKDIDENGESLKPHYHILMCWEGPVSLNYVRSFAEDIGLGSYIERVRSISNILNYLTHNSYSKTTHIVERYRTFPAH